MERGASLIVAMIVLTFLTILGGGLLTTATLDIHIGDNYVRHTQLLYLAEAGIDNARELLRTSPDTPSEMLTAAAGPNLTLSDSTDPETLRASDDVPLFDEASLTDAGGRVIGTYHVYVRNDVAEGVTNPKDENETLRILSVATISKNQKVVDAMVKRARFPQLPAALTIPGPVGVLDFANSNLEIDSSQIGGELDLRLRTVAGLEKLVASMTESATSTLDPDVNSAASIGDVGSMHDPKLVVVNGDVALGPGVGYGVLVARGNVTVTGNFTWNGLVLILGQGVIHWNAGSFGVVNGAMLIARTRADDRAESNILGTVLAAPGPVTVNFNGSSGAIHFNTPMIDAANRVFPYVPISIIEY